MEEQKQCQVAIHIQDKAIKFLKPQDLFEYIDGLRKQARHQDKLTKIWIEDWQNYEHFPLLTVIDDETQERFFFDKQIDLPVKTLLSSQGKKLIVIEPQGEDVLENQEVQKIPTP